MVWGGIAWNQPADGNGFTYSLSNNVLSISQNGVLVLTATLNPATGEYSIAQAAPIDHGAIQNENDLLLSLGYVITDGDGDTSTGTLALNLDDDMPQSAPTIDDVKPVPPFREDIVGETTGFLNASIGADSPGVFVLTPEQNETVTVAGLNGPPSEVRFEVNGDGTGLAGLYSEGIAFILEVNPQTGEYNFVQFVEIEHDSDGLQFSYSVIDGDGDTVTGDLTIAAHQTLLVGSDSNDAGIPDSQKPQWTEGETNSGDNTGELGDAAKAIIVGDAGGLTLEEQNFNITFMLDTSGSMNRSELEDMANAVKNLIDSIKDYNGGSITVHLVDFDRIARGVGVYDITTQSGYDDVMAQLDGIKNKSGGSTNYEAAMVESIEWLSGRDSSDVNYSYFISDGRPTAYIVGESDFGYVYEDFQNRTKDAMDNVRGNAHPNDPGNPEHDTVSEIERLQALSHVIAVGVGTNLIRDTLAVDHLNEIASDSQAILVDDTTELTGALLDNLPNLELNPTGSDHIKGSGLDDLLYGDVMNTDSLADLKGLNTPPGSGWNIFEYLEDNDPFWNRSDTIEYIKNNKEVLAVESLDSSGVGRIGGHDEIYGGAGNDLIFGQEGNDLMSGGAGDDILSGGTGNDTFVWSDEDVVKGVLQVDTITDFELLGGSSSHADILDMQNLLSGFVVGSTNAEKASDLNDFLQVVIDSNSTTLLFDDTMVANTPTDLTIVLRDLGQNEWSNSSYNVDFNSFDQEELLESMLNNGQLIV